VIIDENFIFLKKKKIRIFTFTWKHSLMSFKARVVPGRDPDRWRMDPAGNIVLHKMTGCYGCLCYGAFPRLATRLTSALCSRFMQTTIISYHIQKGRQIHAFHSLALSLSF
jgi:hypothetical protein